MKTNKRCLQSEVSSIRGVFTPQMQTHTHRKQTLRMTTPLVCLVWCSVLCSAPTCGLRYICIYCNTSHTATRCNTLQHTATHCNTLQHTATRGGILNILLLHVNCGIHIYAVRHHTHHTLQHTGKHCNTLQHTATHCNATRGGIFNAVLQHVNCGIYTYTVTHHTLQHTATRCNTLQHTATHIAQNLNPTQ